ncbi:MAG: TetR/AcrR family transcriptional regulator, partial [Tenacibaculum sp.]
MKSKILEKSAKMFLSYGFKSITMDDIANAMGMSKKTLYKHFPNKANLIDATTLSVQEKIESAILNIKSKNYNAIEEEFEVKAIFKEMFKNTKTSPMLQLSKYYPETYAKLIERELSIFKQCNTENLTKGIKQGLYRKDIDKSLTGNFYFALIIGIFENEIYGHQMHELLELEYKVLEYHIRAIATKKGLTELEKQLELL